MISTGSFRSFLKIFLKITISCKNKSVPTRQHCKPFHTCEYYFILFSVSHLHSQSSWNASCVFGWNSSHIKLKLPFKVAWFLFTNFFKCWYTLEVWVSVYLRSQQGQEAQLEQHWAIQPEFVEGNCLRSRLPCTKAGGCCCWKQARCCVLSLCRATCAASKLISRRALPPYCWTLHCSLCLVLMYNKQPCVRGERDSSLLQRADTPHTVENVKNAS